jgi:hypothetical protein
MIMIRKSRNAPAPTREICAAFVKKSKTTAALIDLITQAFSTLFMRVAVEKCPL